MKKKSKFNVFTFMMLIILGLTFQPVISAYAECPDGITSYWKLGEANGPTYSDFIDDNDGTGAANPIADPDGVVDGNGAQAFDGTNQGIDVPADSSFNWLSSDSFSIEAWLKIDTALPPAATQVIVGRKDAGAPDISWFIAVEPSGKASFNLKDASAGLLIGALGTIDVADGSWHHVVAVRDDSAGAPDTGRNFLYVDGNLQQESADINYTAGFLSTSAEINIGWLDFPPPAGEFRFKGSIDEVALYNKALSVDDVRAHYDNGAPIPDYCLGSDPVVSDAPFPEDTISLWTLEEADGPDYFDSFDDNDGTGAANPIADPDGVVDGNGAQAFDGTNQGIDVAADSSFNWLSSDSFSIEAWLKIDTALPPAATQVIVGRKDAGAPDISWFIAVEPSGKASFNLKDASAGLLIGALGTIDVADGSWHHVVAVRDDSAGAPDTGRNFLYVDGNLQQESADINYTAGFLSTSAEINIGWLDFPPPAGEFRFKGSIDEVALYDRALDPVDDILAHYNAGRAGKDVQSLRPAPDADALANPTNPKETTLVTLDGSGSTDGYAGATITTYLWEQTAGTPVTLPGASASPTATFDAPDFVAAGQPLTFQLTVTADDGQSDSDTVDVGVVDRIPPVADAGVSQNVTEGATVTLDGTGSSDADGTIVSYLWEEVTTTGVTINNDTTTPTATFTAPDVDAAGATLTFKLTVTDDDGLTDSATTTVTVSDSPIAPSADAGADQNVTEGDPVTLNGTGSTGTGLTFAWSPSTGSGWALSDATAESPTFTAPDVDAAGAILTFQLTVTDNLGATSSDDVNVNVADASSPLQAVAGDDQTVTVGDTVTLDSTGSTGPIASYAWEQVIIADESRVQLSNADTPTATFIAPDASASDDVAAALLETLTFQLTVTDNTGAESSDTVEVNIDDGTSTRSGGGGGGGGCFINSMF